MGCVGMGVDAVLIIIAAWILSGGAVSIRRNPTAFPLMIAATIVGVAELLSIGSWLASPWGWIAAHTLLLFFLVLLIKLRITSFRTNADITPFALELPRTWTDWHTRNLALLLLVILFVMYGILAWICVKVPPNNWDSLTYHLPRVGYYLQQGHLGHFSTPNPRQTDFPCNAELLIMWTVVFLRSDTLANLAQWIAAICGAVAAWETMLMLGVRRSTAALVSMGYLSLPMVVFQATSTQNDLVITWFSLSALLYGVRFALRPATRNALLFGVSIGLAIGTKNTILLAGPGFVIVFLAICCQGKNFERALRGLRLGVATILGILLFGSIWGIENLSATGHLFSEAETATQRIKHPGLRSFSLNAIRYGYQWFDWTGMPRQLADQGGIASTIHDHATAKLGRDRIEEWNDPRWTIGPTTAWPIMPYTLHEDLAWFGPNGWLCLLPAVIYGTWWAVRRRLWLHLSLLFPVLTFVLCDLWFLKWQPWAGRLFCLPVGMSLPLAALGLDVLRSNRVRIIWQGLVTILAIVTVIHCGLFNSTKRFSAIRRKDPLTLRFPHHPELVEVTRWVADRSRPGLTIGFFGHSDDADYICFLPRFEMHVKRFSEDPAVLLRALAERDLDLIVARCPEEKTPNVPDEYAAERLTDNWLVLEKRQPANQSFAVFARD